MRQGLVIIEADSPFGRMAEVTQQKRETTLDWKPGMAYQIGPNWYAIGHTADHATTDHAGPASCIIRSCHSCASP